MAASSEIASQATLPDHAIAPALAGQPRKPALPALTGLRTVLAVNVMFFHFTPPHPNFLTPLINNAFVFVGFFFLISGFVLAYNYADRPQLSKRRFYIARLSRIYPVYLLVLLLSLPFLRQEWTAHTHTDFFTGLALTPIALQGWSPTLATFWNTVGWTVPAEFLLYGIFPFLLLLIASFDSLLSTPRRIVLAILGLWVIGIAPHVTYLLTNPDHLAAQADRYTYAYWLRVLKYSPVAYICTFSAGVLLARLHARLVLSPRRRALLAAAALIAISLFLTLAVQHIPYVLVHGSLLLPLFAILLLGLAGSNPVSALFAWRPIVLFGETTFCLYLLHFNAFILIHLYNLPQRLHVARFDPWISYAFIMLLALAVLFWYERPVRKLFLRLFEPARA